MCQVSHQASIAREKRCVCGKCVARSTCCSFFITVVLETHDAWWILPSLLSASRVPVFDPLPKITERTYTYGWSMSRFGTQQRERGRSPHHNQWQRTQKRHRGGREEKRRRGTHTRNNLWGRVRRLKSSSHYIPLLLLLLLRLAHTPWSRCREHLPQCRRSRARASCRSPDPCSRGCR